MELTNDYPLTQMIDKPTRENNILDLVFTTVLKPVTDHNIVKLNINRVSQGNKHTVRSAQQTEKGIKECNFKLASQDQLKKAFATTDGDRATGDENKTEKANQNFVNAIIAAAEATKVPKFKISNQQQLGNKHSNTTQLIKERKKISKQLEVAKHLREKDRKTKQT